MGTYKSVPQILSSRNLHGTETIVKVKFWGLVNASFLHGNCSPSQNILIKIVFLNQINYSIITKNWMCQLLRELLNNWKLWISVNKEMSKKNKKKLKAEN